MNENIESEKWRQNFLSDLKNSIDEKSYPRCDSSLVKELITAHFMVERGYRGGFNDFSMEIESAISDALEPFREYNEKNFEELTSEERSYVAFSNYWWSVMGGNPVVMNKQSVKGGDVLNKAISSWESDTALDCFEIIEDRFIKTKDREFDIEGLDYDALGCDIEELAEYVILMMCFDRLHSGNYLSKHELSVP